MDDFCFCCGSTLFALAGCLTFSPGLARALETLATCLTESPARLNRSRTTRAGMQLTGDAWAIYERFAAPFAVAQPFWKIDVASFTVHF